MKTKKNMKNLLFAFLGLLLVASCKDKESPPPKKVASIAIAPSSASVAVGLTQQLTTTVEPSDAEKKEVTWSSSDPSKASVDAAGLVTGLTKGVVTITALAKDGSNVKETIIIHVTVSAAVIAITPLNLSVGVGGTLALAAAVSPAGAYQAVTWTSSAPTIAAIDPATGVATGASVGTAVITASAADGSNITQTVSLTVKSNEVSVSAITLGHENLHVPLPAEGGYASISNVPHTAASDIRKVKVNITTTAEATIKIGDRLFVSGYTADFSLPVTFTVIAPDGTTAKNYTVGIVPYDAKANPYGIYTVKHLVNVAKGLDKSFLLMNNIDLPNADAAGAAATGIRDYATAGWNPLGTFTGIFDGGNFRINNLYVNREWLQSGLFGRNQGTVKNLGVNGIISGTAVTGMNAGILAGFSSGIIDKCYVAGNVSSALAPPSSSSSAFVAGGLVGHVSGGTISNSYATGNVSSTSTSSSSTSAFVAGGLAGYVERGAISNSYATGNVSSAAPSASASFYIGGLTGRNNEGTYTNCYRNSSATVKKNNADAAPNDASIAGIVAKTKDYMQTDAFKADLNGPAGTIWGRENSRNDNLPYIVGAGR